MTLGNILDHAQKEFEDANIETARLDAEVLLAHAAGKDRAWLYSERDSNADENILKQFENFVAQRKDRCPVAYITGEKEFWSIPIKVTRDVLIPRPETELVVEQALKLHPPLDPLPSPRLRSGQAREGNICFEVLDLCCGSGCIAAALAHEMPKANFTLADRSASAIEVAKENLAFASGRVKFLCGDLFEGIEKSTPPSPSPYQRLWRDPARGGDKGEGIFDLIVSNPPYVPLTEKGSLAGEITRYEPQMALFGGKDGLDFIRRIIENAPRFLRTGGWLVMEMGFGQAVEVKTLADKLGTYNNFSVHKDLAGIERVVSMRRS